MANTFDSVPNNFDVNVTEAKPKSVTRYLDLAGLTAFWGKAKEYVDNQDSAVKTILTNDLAAKDAAVRSYIESLEVNGVQVVKTPTEGLGESLAVTIDGEDILVAGENATYKAATVAAAVNGLDTRLVTAENKLAEGVVSGLTFAETHDSYTDKVKGEDGSVSSVVVPSKVWVDVKVNDAAIDGNEVVGDVKIAFDDTAINDKFASIDEEIAFLEANAGVTNIKAVDTNDGADLVSISVAGTKTPTAEGEGWCRGDITITLDESALDAKFAANDEIVSGEIEDRKHDIAALAGEGYTVSIAEEDQVGTWDEGVKYNNITDLSERLAAIDDNLVTTIEVVDTDKEGAKKNYVAFTKVDSVAEGDTKDNAVTLTVDESALDEYIATNEDNLAALNGLKVNEKQLITVDATGDQVAVTSSSITLTTEDIDRPGAKGNLEETLADHDSKIAALSSATHFRGVKGDIPATAYEGLDYGDIIVVGSKEYIYNADPEESGWSYNVNQWVELGDTTAETARISAIEKWVDESFITTTDIEALGWTPAITAPQA